MFAFSVSVTSPPPLTAARGVTERFRRNEGGNTTVEAIFIVPMVFLLIFAAIQTSVIWHGQTVLHAAAARALRAERTRAAGIETETAQQAVDAVVARDAKFVARATAVVGTGNQLVVVTVTGDVSGPFPGLTMHLKQRVSGYDERFRPLCGTGC
jgi:Flp pilus assembly protein TadG